MLPRREDAALSETEVSFRSPFELHSLEEGEVSPHLESEKELGLTSPEFPGTTSPPCFPSIMCSFQMAEG